MWPIARRPWSKFRGEAELLGRFGAVPMTLASYRTRLLAVVVVSAIALPQIVSAYDGASRIIVAQKDDPKKKQQTPPPKQVQPPPRQLPPPQPKQVQPPPRQLPPPQPKQVQPP